MTIAIIAVAIILVIVMAILALAASKPDSFRYERKLKMPVPPERIFPLINDLRDHLKWSPFEKDPSAKRKMSGAEIGQGSIYEWDGNKDVGAGRIEITDSVPNSQVTMALQFYRPFPAKNTVVFTLATQADGTNVSWAMQGPQPFMMKVMSCFINCEKMIGTHFDQGLASLKKLAEA